MIARLAWLWLSISLSQAVYAFTDFQNLAVNLEKLRQAREAYHKTVQQLSTFKQQLSIARSQAKDVKVSVKRMEQNLVRLDASKLRELKKLLKHSIQTLKQYQQINHKVGLLERDYDSYFNKQCANKGEQQTQLSKKIAAVQRQNQRALTQVIRTQTYEQDLAKIQEYAQDSAQATGMLQAVQSTNNLLAVSATQGNPPIISSV